MSPVPYTEEDQKRQIAHMFEHKRTGISQGVPGITGEDEKEDEKNVVSNIGFGAGSRSCIMRASAFSAVDQAPNEWKIA